ncbi:peptidyl-prolyl cis-trans isomerase [Allomuricauda sp. d1]|uniref:peptidyl-prolyl cis-trans isomerase n=1 Tax=Allomuricauda sp. d1 TaxID=3136725 RepID=UPI0031D91286
MRLYERINFSYILGAVTVMLLSSCDALFSPKDEKEPLARVGDSYLYKEDVASLIPNDMSAQDSAFYMANYVNRWATKQLLLTKAKINLSEERQSEYNRLVEDYRADLYTRAYMDALVQQSSDTTVSEVQLRQFYENEKDNFKLDEKLARLRFVEVSNQFLDKEEVEEKMRRFNSSDRKYLDSITVQFKKIHFDDSVWVSTSRLMEEIRPLDYQNADRHLKKSQFFELRDSLGIYLGKVTDVLKEGEVAPLSYISPKIRQIILNRRRLNYIKNLEKDILDEAIKTNEFEVYAEED